MTFDEVVIREVQPNSRFEVLTLLAEGVCQTGQPLHVQPRRGVQALHITCGYEVPVRVAENSLLLALGDLRRTVAALRFDGVLGAVYLDDLAVIDVVLSERLLNVEERLFALERGRL